MIRMAAYLRLEASGSSIIGQVDNPPPIHATIDIQITG